MTLNESTKLPVLGDAGFLADQHVDVVVAKALAVFSSVDEVVLIRRGITVLYGTGVDRAYSAITYNVAHRSLEGLPRQVTVVEGLVDQLERLLGCQCKTVDRSEHLIE